MTEFSSNDYWRAIILYGLNQATYKIALGKSLIGFAKEGVSTVGWEQLSKSFLSQYKERLNVSDAMPQQSIPFRRTYMERVVSDLKMGRHTENQAIEMVGQNAFNDVVYRFHTLIGVNGLANKFYEFEFGKRLIITDELFKVVQSQANDLLVELDARWALLEGAFSISTENYQLANEIREIFLVKGSKRRSLTSNIPFLQGYQGNVCFYCCETIKENDIHVDHVLPRQVLQHDELWNLVLAHSLCNERKSDHLVGPLFIEKLMARNENIIGSNHPLKKKLIDQLGATSAKRRETMIDCFEKVKKVRGSSYWSGSETYNPAVDPFYKRLITVINNN